MNKTYTAVIILVLVVVGGLFLFGRSKTSEAPTVDTSSTDTGKEKMGKMQAVEIPGDYNVSVSDTTAPVKEFTVTGQNFSFSPATISVKKGDRVKITFKNAEGFHNFVLDDFKVSTKTIQTGSEDVVEFMADKVGSFQYYCSVGSHRAMGMWGTLTVE